MPLGPSVPLPHVAQTKPINLFPPVALVGGIEWNVVMDSLDDISKFRQTIVNAARYYPIGHLEVGATLSVDPKDAALPGGFEGETQFSHQTLLFMGMEIALHCKVNLFYDIPAGGAFQDNLSGVPINIAGIGNRGGFYEQGFTFHPSARAGMTAYWTHVLGRNPVVDNSTMPLFAIAHVATGYFEYLIILNARLSSPARSFPIGASSVTLDIEAYSNGIGIVSSFFPKVGDDIRGGSGGANANMHIIDAIETFMVAGVIVNFNQYLVTSKQSAGIVHPGFGEITAKLHSRAAPNTGQLLYARRIPITPLAIWGGSTNINDSQLLSPNYFRIVPG